jgi:hypothetical protein
VIWLRLISDLLARNFINIPPGQDLQGFSLDALINMAKRSIQGPASWSTSGSTQSRIAHQIFLYPIFPFNAGAVGDDEIDEVMLLSGGQYVLFLHAERLRCWSVTDDQPIWDYPAQRSPADVISIQKFTAEVVDGGQAIVIVVAGKGFPNHYRDQYVLPSILQ